MIPITSLDDPRVADYRSLADAAEMLRANLFVVEGRLNVRRLLSLPRYQTHSVLVTQTALAALGRVDRRGGRSSDERSPSNPTDRQIARSTDRRIEPPVYVVDQSLMNDIAGFNIHRGCVALAERPEPTRLIDLPLATAERMLVLEGVNNPDNVGGIFRSAAAFGVDAVVLGPQCSDPLYRKAIRTSMGATLQVPFASADLWPEALAPLREHGFRLLALTPAANDARALDDIPRTRSRVALMVGAEGDGLSAEALAAADERVRIAMVEGADSLNVVVAASIALYHFRRRT